MGKLPSSTQIIFHERKPKHVKHITLLPDE